MSCIEFIGCTSSGKTTLVNLGLQICQANNVDAWLGEDFLLDQFYIGKVCNTSIRTILVNSISPLIALFNLRKYWHFFCFALRNLTRLQNTLVEKVYLCRNIIKSIGIYEIACSKTNSDQIIFLDEGPLQIANILFVHRSQDSTEGALSDFVHFIPFPDAIVYLREKEDVLIQRTLSRRHKRIRNGNLSDVKQFVQSAVAVFERLTQEPAVQPKLFIINERQVRLPIFDSGNQINMFVQILISNCVNIPFGEKEIPNLPVLIDSLNTNKSIGDLCEDKS
jgi:hypothetical protein